MHVQERGVWENNQGTGTCGRLLFKKYAKCHHVYKIFQKMDSVLISSWRVSTISYQATTQVILSSKSELFSYCPKRVWCLEKMVSREWRWGRENTILHSRGKIKSVGENEEFFSNKIILRIEYWQNYYPRMALRIKRLKNQLE